MKEGKLALISVKMPLRLLEEIDDLVRKGVFVSRSEMIRQAVRHYLKHVVKGEKENEQGKDIR